MRIDPVKAMETMKMRPHWREACGEIRARLADAGRVLVASDFDGTLSELVRRPEDAVPLAEARVALESLVALAPRVRVALLSGRGVEDLMARVGLDPEGFLYVGNHGLEFRGCGMDWNHPDAAAVRPALDELRQRLHQAGAAMEGVQLEDKGASLSLHYRRLAENRHAELSSILNDLQLPEGLRRQEGKLVVDFRPAAPWNKGSALREILKKTGVPAEAAFFAGDDVTDEDAFEAIRDTGMTLHVGSASAPSKAWLQAADPADAAAFLRELAAMLAGGP